jgi:tetratricopeptide (TPR) repeat protein
MSRYLLIIMIALYTSAFGQTTEKYNSEYAEFYRAEELFEKEQYGAARRTFRAFIDELNKPNDPMQVKARYYEAISALELYNNDALGLLEDFNYDYPESIYKKEIYFRLGKFYYYKKDYKNAIVWFNKLSVQDLEAEDHEEFYFKLGYSFFKEGNQDAARDAFYEVKDGVSEYANPALYYYSHIAYEKEQYQMALDGFLKLENDEKFGKVVAYYIAQIYYLQGKFDLVTEYAARLTADGTIVNEKDLNHLIGDAYYRTGKYEEAVPYLEKYNRVANTDRGEDYRLGYAYYRTGKCDQAIRMFDRVKKVKDSLGQVAFYHIGECLLKADNKVSARSAFEEAAFIDSGDPIIQEDALYNYAILSYKLDINPYDEAVEAFEMYLNKYPNSDRRDDVYSYLVNVYTSTNNYEKALSSLDKIPNKDIKLKMAYQLVAFNQGVDHYEKSNFPGAIKSFDLVNKYPVDPKLTGLAVYWKADANYRLRKYDDAVAGYKQFKLLPSTMSPQLKRDADYNIGYCYVDRAQAAQQAVNKAVDEGSSDEVVRRARAKARPLHELVISSFGTYIQSNPTKQNRKADAYMRIADANFLIGNNDEAVRNYQNALDMNAGYEDQASFYMAKTYGYMAGRLDDKIAKLLNIINNFKESKYLQLSIYEVAESYKSLEQYAKAKQYYEQIVNDHPSSNLVMSSKINIAFIQSKLRNYVQAERIYQEVMDTYGSNQDVCKEVANGLKDMYLEMNEPEKIEQLAQRYPCFKLDPNEQENLYYIPAMDAYNDSTVSQSQRYQQAIPKFEKYLSKFPNGRYKDDVRFYLGNCHYELGNEEQAMAIYRKLLEGTANNSNTITAGSRVAQYLFNNGRYEEVIQYYRKLETSSSDPAITFNAKLGLMRSYFLTENWANASEYADKVLSNGQLSSEHKLQSHYVKGMSNYYLNNFQRAKSSLEWMIQNVTEIRGAESRYALADLYYMQGDYQKALDGITGLLKMKPAYNFWIAKGLILQTRVYMAQDQLFDAEQTLKSVREHYGNQTDGIIDEANTLWDELMQLKDQPKNIVPDRNPIIDINGQ